MKYKLIIKEKEFNYHINYCGAEAPFLLLLLQMPNITKIDILEYFEYSIFGLCDFYDLDLACGQYLNIENLFENSSNPTYASEYFGVMGQMFLGGMIDFGIESGNLSEKGTEFDTNLSKINLGISLYEKWVYFRNNYFFKKRVYVDWFEIHEQQIIADWQNPDTWFYDSLWICMTPLGQRYYSEVLLPRIYEKYKDIEVEVGENGEILGWFKNGVKM